jgi:16S rRNA (guanine527-N7)-methyltransferase
VSNQLIQNYEEFVSQFEVSRETSNKLERFSTLLTKWNQKLNLIGKSTIPDLQMRHIVDSAQLIKYLDAKDLVYDFGSGAGFPGLILSFLGIETVHLVESDSRKVKFLQEAAKISNNEIIIHNKRIEIINIERADVITARALAPLDRMLVMIEKIVPTTSRIILFKGRNINQEILQACKNFKFDYDLYPSITANDSWVIEIKNLISIKR